MNISASTRPVPALVIVLGLLLAPATAAAEPVGGTVDDTTDTVNETLDGTTDLLTTPTPTETTSQTATATPTGTLDSTTDTVNETLDSTTDTVNDTVEGTTDTVDDTVEDTSGTVNDTVDGTTDTVDDTVGDTTDTVNDTVDETTNTVDDVTGGATENLTGIVDDTTGEITGTVDDTTDETTDTVDDTTSETTRFLAESDTSNVGMALTGSSTLLGAEGEHDATVALLEAENATDVGMAGGGADEFQASDDDAAAEESHGSGTPVPAVPPEGAAVGALGLAAVGAALVRQGTLTTGPVAPAAAAATEGLAGRLPRLFTPFRYSRFDDSDPLEHEARVEMLDAVEEAPGTYLSEMAEQADLPLSTARHHVRVLEREGLVASAKVRGRRRFYPGGTEGLELAAAMNDEATATVLDALARLGPSSVSGLAEAVDRDPSTVTHHLKRLEEDGLVVRERDGRAMVNRLSPEAAEALDPGLESEEGEPADAAVSAD